MNRVALWFVTALAGAVVLAGAGCVAEEPSLYDQVIDLIQTKRHEAMRLHFAALNGQVDDVNPNDVSGYLIHVGMVELTVVNHEDSLYEDVCKAVIPLERQGAMGFGEVPRLSESSMWGRFTEFLDELEALVCTVPDDELTFIGGSYVGMLGDFRVNQGSVLDGNPCSIGFGEFGPFPSDFHQSELWTDVFSSRAVPDFCADDERLTGIFEYTDRGIMKRGYFYQAPLAVNFNPLRERPQLLELEGRPAILGRDAPPSEQVYLYAIERFPEGDTPGIYIFVLAGGSDGDLARAIAEELLP